MTRGPGHSHCLRLEPVAGHIKPWTFACQSLVDLEAWQYSLQNRLNKLALHLPPPSLKAVASVDDVCSTLPPSYTSSITICSDASSPYHALTTPDNSSTSCFSATSVVSRPRTRRAGPPPSLSHRRGIVLPPLLLDKSNLDSFLSCSTLSPSTLSSSCSNHTPPCLATPPSATTTVDQERKFSLGCLCGETNEGEQSPTFLQYKRQFQL